MQRDQSLEHKLQEREKKKKKKERTLQAIKNSLGPGMAPSETGSDIGGAHLKKRKEKGGQMNTGER